MLIDCGASSMVAIRKWGVDPNGISTVLVSHLHGDHFGGLPFFLLDAQLVSRRTAPLTLAGPPGFEARLMTIMEAMFAGSTKAERKFALTIRELALHERAGIDALHVTPYLDETLQRCAVPQLRIETEGKVLTYSGDTDHGVELIPAGRDADLFICGSARRISSTRSVEIPHRLHDPDQASRRDLSQAHHRHPHERRAARPPGRDRARSRA